MSQHNNCYIKFNKKLSSCFFWKNKMRSVLGIPFHSKKNENLEKENSRKMILNCDSIKIKFQLRFCMFNTLIRKKISN